MAQHNCPSCKCQPEPERCPCDSEGSCCHYRGLANECCSCHRNSPLKHDLPCLSPFHKQPATKDRVVEGFISKGGPAESFVSVQFASVDRSAMIPATLIIHEPAKEMGLYEAVERFLSAGPAGNCETLKDTPPVRADLYAAFHRERAAREKS